ncbi:hypothetical protein FHS15_001502 [Paenibacillus castaneae]|uniref:hypothetical protein n=1 Tax=Paenibacillus castaneae TaxID=474957 RepID=UPI000C9AA4C1|nr:hypothetical protein [Paenibacillus castaneae]NIK76377.1 hypothetical protein [Paenibacillus castaneae]
MRKYALTQSNPSHEIPKVMIHETEDSGVYVYLYKSKHDTSSHNDFWFDDLQDAEDFSNQYFGIENSDWVSIDDPSKGCQHDLIRPIRRKEKPNDHQYEILEDGVWKDIEL